jgi:VanZ family protein
MSTIINRFTLLALLYYGLLSVASSIPGRVLSEVGVNIWDKAVHFCAYFGLGLLLFLGIQRSRKTGGILATFLVTALAMILLGTLDEIHQLFVQGRSSSFGDALADTLGGITGALTAHGATMLLGRQPKLDRHP